MTGKTTYRVGVDIGGTFTDCAVLTDDGRVATGKAPTTPHDLSEGFLNSIANAADVFQHRGKYYCIAGQEVFVGEDVMELIARARAAHPDDQGLITGYIPKEKAIRVYACRLRCRRVTMATSEPSSSI